MLFKTKNFVNKI